MTQSQIKHIRSLSIQKYRKVFKTHLVEGDKNVKVWLAEGSTLIRQLIALPEWIEENQLLLKQYPHLEIHSVKSFELEKMSALKQPQKVLIEVAMQPEKKGAFIPNTWILYLEKIQDPGNMGTIIRTADWFGIQQIFMTSDCVEIYNPKVVQATMGSLLRIDFSIWDATLLNKEIKKDKIPIYATCLRGQSILDFKHSEPGIIAMGNESSGLSDKILNMAQKQITIPKLGNAESLNVGVATGIICAQLILE